MRAHWIFPILISTVIASPSVWASRAIPAAPKYYVYDEAGAVQPQALQSLNTVLYQHAQAAGEQIVVAVFKSLQNEDLVDFTNRVFSTWKIGKKETSNGVLLAIYLDERKIRIEVGYGLEAILTDAKSKRIIENVLVPELRRGDVSRAVSMGALAILQVVSSPVVQSGQAEAALGSLPRQRSSSRGPNLAALAPFLFLGWFLFLIVVRLQGDRHYFRHGRKRLGFFDSSGWGGGFGGGGGGFGGGGGGGFSGGGGSSGGGGASGSW
jgi:uncharacterized protein